MKELASRIRMNLDDLTGEVERRLQEMTSSDPEAVQLPTPAIQAILLTIAEQMEADTDPTFDQLVERMSTGAPGMVQSILPQLITVVEATIIPLVTTKDELQEVWQMFIQKRSEFLQHTIAGVRQAERRKAEMALQESELLFQSIVDYAQTGILIVGPDFRFIYANDELSNILGYSRDELIGMDFRTVLDEESKQIVADRYVRRRRGEEVPSRYGFTAVRKDGEKRDVEISTSLVQDAEGNVRTVGQILDVTEQRQLEREIRALLEQRGTQVRTGTEVAQEVAAATELDELVRRVVTLIKDRFNYYHAQIFRYDPASDAMRLVVGYGDVGERMLAEGHSLARDRGVVGTAATTGEPVLATDVTEDPNWIPNPHLPETKGELAVPIKLRDRVLGILDVQSDTPGALTEEDQILMEGLCGQIAIAIESTQSLEEANIFRQFAQSVNQGLAIANLQGRITYTNPALIEMLEYERPEDLLGHSLIDLYPPSLHQQIEDDVILTAMETGTWAGELELVTADNQPIPTLQNIFLITDEKDAPVYIANVATDITAQKQNETEMAETLKELESLYRSISREGWETIRHQARATGYAFDQVSVSEQDDLWSPTIARAAEEQKIIPSDNDQPTAAVPLSAHDEIFGVLGVQDDPANPLSPEELALIESASQQIAQALESARLFEETQTALNEAELLYRFSEVVGRGIDIQVIYDTAARALVKDLGYESSWIAILDEEAQVLQGVAGAGEKITEDMIYGTTSLSTPGNPAVIAVKQQAPLVVNDPANDPRLTDLEGKKVGATLGKIIEVPLMISDEIKGLVGATRPVEGADIGEREVRLLQAIATQMSVAMQRAQLFDQMQIALDQTDALYSTNWALITAKEPEEMLWAVAESALQAGADVAHLFYVDVDAEDNPEWIEVAATIQISDRNVEPPNARYYLPDFPLAHLLTHNPHEPLLVGEVNASHEALEESSAEYLQSLGTQAICTIPLRIGSRWLGIATLSWPQPHRFTTYEEQLYGAIGPQFATLLDNRRLLEQAQRRTLQLQTASEVSRATTSILTLEELLPQSAELIRDRFNYYYVGIFLLDHGKEHAVLRAGTGKAGKQMIAQRHKLRVDENSMIGWSVANRQPRIALNVGDDATWFDNPFLPETESELALPLVSRGDVVGAMSIQSKEAAAFSEEDVAVLQTIADQLGTAIVNAQLFQEVQESLSEVEAVQRRYLRETWTEYVQQAAWSQAIAYEYDQFDTAPIRPPQTPELAQAINERQPVVHKEGDDDSNGRSALVAPIVLGGEPIGAFTFEDPEVPRDWTPDQIALVDTVSSQVAMMLNSARLYEETQAEAGRRTLINTVMQAAVQSLDPVSLLHEAGEAISSRLETSSALFIFEQTSRSFQPAAFHDVAGDDFLFPPDLMITREMDPILFDTAERQEAQLLESLAPLSGPLGDVITQLEVESAIYVPLVSLDQVLGAFVLYRQAGQARFTSEEIDFATIIGGNISVALQSAMLYQEAVDTAEQWKEIDRLKSQFLANMSHELRTPLNSIIGFSRVILKGIDGPLTDLQRQDLEAIYNSGQHLLGLINDILDISKIEAGKMELAFEEVDVQDVVRGVMSTAIGLVKDKDIELHQFVPDDVPTIVGDTRRIRQVLINLIGNAAKFTEEGFIKVGAEADDKYITLSVSDSGIGIPEDKLEEIFEAFTQVDASATRKYGGTGLGLTVTRSLVQLHGGQIWAESEVGTGSTFYFTIPINGPDSIEDEEEEDRIIERGEERKAEEEPVPSEEDEIEEQEEEGPMVLCVDDNEGVLSLFERYLKKQGYQVTGLADPTRVVEEAKRLQPYAITLDVMMPEIDGWQLIQDLKEDPETHDIPVVMCTIVNEKGRGMSLGAADYLVKPILEQDLLDALDRLDREAGHHRVLIVDDLPDDRSLLRRIIESLPDYEVFEATNGHEAIKMVHDLKPHIIILDLMMPEMDGFTVLETLKANESTRRIPIIVVTAKELTEEERAILQNQIEVLIQKGMLEREELLGDVTAALKKVGRHRLAESEEEKNGENES